MSILIAGAGIGGLTAAIALLRAGFDVHVYERAAEIREVGAGITLQAGEGAGVGFGELGPGTAIRYRSDREWQGLLGSPL